MITDEARDKHPFKNWLLCGVWKFLELLFYDNSPIRLTQNCVFYQSFYHSPSSSFRHSEIPPHSKLLDLLQCIEAHVQHELAWVSGEPWYLGILCWFSFPLGRTRLKVDLFKALSILGRSSSQPVAFPSFSFLTARKTLVAVIFSSPKCISYVPDSATLV